MGIVKERLCMMLLAALCCTGAVRAADDDKKQTDPRPAKAPDGVWYARVKPAAQLVGAEVAKSDGTRVGVLRDFAIDLHTGHVALALISAGTAEEGQISLSVPLPLLWYEDGNFRLRDDASEAQLAAAKRFAAKHGQKPFTRVQVRELYGAFDVEFYGKELQKRPLDGEEPVYLWSQLRSKRIETPAGQLIGEVQDFAVAPNEYRIVYAAVDLSLTGKERAMLHPLPLGAFVLQQGDQPWLLELTEARVADSQSFPRDEWPHEVPTSWVEYVHVRYGDGVFDGMQRKTANQGEKK